MKRPVRYLGAITLATALLSFTGCGSAHVVGSVSKTVTLGFVVDPTWAQVPVAEADGAFRQAGVTVKIIDFDTGPAALEALEAGQVDVATSADVPVAAAYIHDPALRVIADNSAWPGQRIVGSRSAGITSLGDLNGKKLGVPFGTSSEYYISALLASHPGIKPILVNVSPADMVTAILDHDVAAVAIFDPYQAQVAERLGAEAVVLGGPVYVQQGLLLTSTAVLAAKQATLSTFLKALASTDTSLNSGAAGALKTVETATGLPAGLTREVVASFSYTMTLPSDLAVQLTKLANWGKTVGNIPFGTVLPHYGPMLTSSVLPPAT
jgi:NitT/TauT family transport system substrate-binding protein